jgi:hypothetical protein
MLHVASLQVRSYDLDHLDLFWEIPATSEILDDYWFFVERCVDGAAGPYQEIAGPFLNTYMFRDPDVRPFHKWRQYFYRIRIVNRTTGDEQTSEPAFLQAEPDLIALEIRRLENLVFQEHNGRQVIVFPALTFGQRCGHCYDQNAQGNSIGRSKMQNCPSCYDTTFVGGFASPMLVWAQIDPSVKANQPSDIGNQVQIDTTGRTTWFPPLKPQDMIVEAENKRWAVRAVTPTEKLRAQIRQELQLHQYPRDDIRYKIPVNIDLLRKMSPPREFKRLMDLQEARPAHQEVRIK